MKSRLFYDANCPICNNYVRMLQKKIHPDKIQFIPTKIKTGEFQFATADNRVFNGQPAIEELAKAFPEVLSYFWMLPDKFKIVGLKTAYTVGKIVRKAIKRKKGCGCKG